jgi:isochorismate synthase
MAASPARSSGDPDPPSAILPALDPRRLAEAADEALARTEGGGREAVAQVERTDAMSWEAALALACALLDASTPGDYATLLADRDGGVLQAGRGVVHVARSHGALRMGRLMQEVHELARTWHAQPSTLRFLGGITFHPNGAAEDDWAGRMGSELVLHALHLHWQDGRLTTRARTLVRAGEPAFAVELRLAGALARPGGEAAPPASDAAARWPAWLAQGDMEAHYVAAVGQVLQAIQRGTLRKGVVARCARISLPAPMRPSTVVQRLVAGQPRCHVYAFGCREELFVGATPETLCRWDGRTLASMALAGSVPATHADPRQALLQSAKDRAEHAIVVEHVVKVLRQAGLEPVHPVAPSVLALAQVHHLHTPVEAPLGDAALARQVAQALHPTPAVAGDPLDAATRILSAVEPFDRGWYAAPVGWVQGDGAFHWVVALRCALVAGRQALLFAGAGIVAGSDPHAEWRETETKMAALRAALLPPPSPA